MKNLFNGNFIIHPILFCFSNIPTANYSKFRERASNGPEIRLQLVKIH